MAGEWSKKIGEDGERIALKLMKIIGWENLEKGIDIPCIENESHSRKKAHGLDGLFSYKSPLHDRTLRHVCISVKYHDDSYPVSSSLASTFKDHLAKLDATIECFENSDLLDKRNGLWASGIDRSESFGLIVWLHGNREDKSRDDLLDSLESTRPPKEVELKRPIMLIDQSRANFIFETHDYVSQNYSDHSINFNYHRTGNNNLDSEVHSDGAILPWELLNSGVLIYRAIRKIPDEKVLIFASIDRFDEGGFKRLLSLAQHISNNLSNQIEICFPDYVEIRHANTVNSIKSSFENDSFTRMVNVNSYKKDLRN